MDIQVSQEHLTQAFDLWEQDYRKDPSAFLTADEASQLEVATLSEGRAIAMIGYLRQAAGAAVPTTTEGTK